MEKITEDEIYARLWIIRGNATATAREIKDTLIRMYEGWDEEKQSHFLDPREED